MELGLDLGGQKDDQRRAVVGNLIRLLQLPPKPVAFWPVSVLRDGELVPDREMFWRGWQRWKTAHIVCFGQEAARIILPDADSNLSVHMLSEVMVHVLPSMEQLVQMSPQEISAAVKMLAAIRF